ARSVLLAVVDAALDALGEMREREGAALARDLGLRGATIAAIVERIRARMPLVVRTHQENLHKRVAELLGPGTALAPADLAREIALIADRLDVTEELTRLASHLGQLQALCAKRTPVGRQLDFLVQEFLREANTIGSKCNDAEVAHAVVELKTEIERLREQVQNVE
ncbi:MAG: YicC family protein, partial [Planctomycetota bacterium]